MNLGAFQFLQIIINLIFEIKSVLSTQKSLLRGRNNSYVFHIIVSKGESYKI
jgi:hypothetical protein